MERSELIKIVAILIAAMFVIELFMYFKKEPKEMEEEGKTVVAQGFGTGKIKKYSPEIIIDEINEEINETIRDLRKAGKISYVKQAGNKWILVLPLGENITRIRERFDAEASAEAIVEFKDFINFTTVNETSSLFVEQQRIYFDPITPMETEVDFTMVADINLNENKIVNLRLNPEPRISLLSGNGKLNCSGVYEISTSIPWEERENISKITELISEEKIKYEKREDVLFSRRLNISEMGKVSSLNRSYIFGVTFTSLSTNTTNKSIIEEDLKEINFSNLTLSFPSSKLSAFIENLTIAGELNKTYNITIRRDCVIDLKLEDVYIPVKKRKIASLVALEKTNKENVSVIVQTEYIGKKITDVEILNVE